MKSPFYGCENMPSEGLYISAKQENMYIKTVYVIFAEVSEHVHLCKLKPHRRAALALVRCVLSPLWSECHFRCQNCTVPFHPILIDTSLCCTPQDITAQAVLCWMGFTGWVKAGKHQLSQKVVTLVMQDHYHLIWVQAYGERFRVRDITLCWEVVGT